MGRADGYGLGKVRMTANGEGRQKEKSQGEPTLKPKSRERPSGFWSVRPSHRPPWSEPLTKQQRLGLGAPVPPEAAPPLRKERDQEAKQGPPYRYPAAVQDFH